MDAFFFRFRFEMEDRRLCRTDSTRKGAGPGRMTRLPAGILSMYPAGVKAALRASGRFLIQKPFRPFTDSDVNLAEMVFFSALRFGR